MENLTAEQGFHAMFLFLDRYHREMSGEERLTQSGGIDKHSRRLGPSV